MTDTDDDSSRIDKRIDDLREDVAVDQIDSVLRPEWPPVDYQTVGPLDLVALLIYWSRQRIRYVAPAALLIALGIGYGSANGYWSLEIPVEGWVVIISAVAAMGLGLYPVRGVVDVLWSDESHTLIDIDPVDGDVAVYELSDWQFTDLTVEGSDGEEISNPSTSLHEVRLSSGGTGYEVESYDPEDNTASVSWMAGARNVEIRRHQRMVDVIIEELSIEAERSLDEIIEAPELMRQHGSEVVNQMIQIAEGERSPGEASVAESIGELTREQHEQTDSLISDRGIDDIEARIEELEDRSSSSEEASA